MPDYTDRAVWKSSSSSFIYWKSNNSLWEVQKHIGTYFEVRFPHIPNTLFGITSHISHIPAYYSPNAQFALLEQCCGGCINVPQNVRLVPHLIFVFFFFSDLPITSYQRQRLGRRNACHEWSVPPTLCWPPPLTSDLLLRRPPVVPEVRQQPRVVVVRERRAVVIETRVTCVNEPTVRWLHDQRQVPSDSRHHVVIQQVSQVSWFVRRRLNGDELRSTCTWRLSLCLKILHWVSLGDNLSSGG